ncbi:hypothetical protein HNR19_003208 [Nocardioides thalensis]|uniref:Polyketide cyclase n=1 Tax=Nocardioides thalensis TaxID=1914755 RepID=A0A853C2V4_9ACTN|nr:hypothetical protein [Nocardioides thalensis]
MRTSYSFSASWVTPASMAEVASVVSDLERYPEWWPQVRAVAKIDDDTARVLCRAALPYTLDLVLHAVSREAPVLEVALSGDLDGWVRWTLSEADGGTRTEFEQEVAARGALAAASYVARPLLRWNHDRMMAGCRAGLERRLV